MQDNILAAERSDELRVHVVWLNQRPTDARDTIDPEIMADPRVTQYWDEEAVIGTHFAELDLGGLGYSGIVYDTFYLLGPDATWDGKPEPLEASGSPVLTEGERLLTAIRAQL